MSTKSTNQFDDMSPDMREFIDLMVATGFIGDPSIKDSKIRQIKQELNKKAYHNTEMLLRKYKDCEWILKTFPVDVAEELEAPFAEADVLLDKVDTELSLGNARMQAKFDSFKKVRICIDRLLHSVTLLRSEPACGELLYNIINLRYIAPGKRSYEEIAAELNISEATYHRRKKQAIELISFSLWGINNASTSIALQAVEIFKECGDVIESQDNKK